MAKFLKSLRKAWKEILNFPGEMEFVLVQERGHTGELELRVYGNGTRCIYEVPDRLRKVNPKAYTPQMLAIGVLQYSASRYKFREMERIKKDLLKSFKKIYGTNQCQKFENIVETNREFIKNSYPFAVGRLAFTTINIDEMILLDSVFILLFFIQNGSTLNFTKKSNILHELPRTVQENVITIKEDLILLENQLPYALLEKLFEPFFSNLTTTETFRDITLRTFGFEGKIKEGVTFLHFTDLFWLVRVSTLPLAREQISIAVTEPPKSRKIMYNAEKLYSAGVDFENVDEGNDLSLVINFKDRILKLPCFTVYENTERELRNIMAFEQCHYRRTTYVCDYISFLGFLIKTDQDVDLLVSKGLLRNHMGDDVSVMEMLKKLCLGLEESRSQYYDDVSERLNKYYENPLNRTFGTLRRVYFKDIWTGTSTVAAVVLLVLTLLQTVASFLQVTQNDNKSLPTLAPSRGP